MKKVRVLGVAVAVALVVAPVAWAADYVDPAEFGLAPGGVAATNAVALQKALDGGCKVVKVTVPGVYDLDRRIYFDSDTTFECAPGVTFRRAANYANMFVNRGAWNYHSNSNITVRGLHIAVNKMGDLPGYQSPCPGLRGQVAFYNVSRIRVYDFKCLDLTAQMYCIQFAKFEDFIMDGFEIRGKKDGVHVNGGSNFVIRNGLLETGDDGIALNAGDWPVTCTPYMGSIRNGVIENIHDMPGGRCNFARVITGCWREWFPGMKLQRGDIFRVGKNVYSVALPKISTNEFVSTHKPTHTRGLVTGEDDLPYLWLQDDGETRADIENVVFRNCFLHSKRSISCSWEFGSYARLIHPTIEKKDYPKIDITLDHVVSDSGAPIVRGNADAVICLRGCKSSGRLVAMGGGSCGESIYPTTRRIIVEGCYFPDDGSMGHDFVFSDPRGDVKVAFSGCIFDREPAVHAPSTTKLSVTCQ